MVFPCPGAVFLRGLFSPKNRVLKPDPSSSEIIIFYGFPLSPFFRGRRQGRQPLNSAPPAPHEWLACPTSVPERLELYGEARPKPPTGPEKHQKSFRRVGESFLDGIRVAHKRLQEHSPPLRFEGT